MRSSREMDVQVSQDVLGHRVVKQKSGAWVEGTPRGSRPLPAYSKEISAAWEVASRACITLIPIEDGTWFAMAGNGRGWKSPTEFMQFLQTAEFMESGAAVAENPALAICVAALKASEKRQNAGERVDIDSSPGTPTAH